MPIAVDECAVHWLAALAVGHSDVRLLTNAELERARALRRRADRERYVAATALLRRLVAEETGMPPDRVVIDRRCSKCGKAHGRPTLPGLGLEASITHSGGVIGVSLTRAGPVGLDVEAVDDRDVASLASEILGDGEEARDRVEFYRCWTRKEALVKATGDGIGVGLRHVLVAEARHPPVLRSYPGRSGLIAQMADLSVVPGHVASVAVLTDRPTRFVEHWHHNRPPRRVPRETGERGTAVGDVTSSPGSRPRGG